MKYYINGCYTKNGSRPMKIMEIKKKMYPPNGMYCVIGFINSKEDGISIDVYSDDSLSELVFMEHRIISNLNVNDDLSDDEWKVFSSLAIRRCKEMGL